MQRIESFFGGDEQRLTVLSAKADIGGPWLVEGSRTSVYIRGNQNSSHEGAVSLGMIIESTAPNQTLNVELLQDVDVVTVNLAYSGTATDGADFTGVASVTISANTNSTTFTLPTLDDALAEGAEDVIIDIDSISSGGFEAIAEHSLETHREVTSSRQRLKLAAALRNDAFAVVDRAGADLEQMLRILQRALQRFYEGRWPSGQGNV